MKIDLIGRAFIIQEEGVRLKAYLCSAGVPTIGVGCTYYPDGKKVKMGDEITVQQSNEMFSNVVKNFETAVTNGVKVSLNQNQFNALVSLAYNIGTAAFLKSTLLKLINAKAAEGSIRNQFAVWNKAGGKVLPGLVARRKREADLYFTKP